MYGIDVRLDGREVHLGFGKIQTFGAAKFFDGRYQW